MAGILDYYNDPSNQGILALAAGLMQAGGASPHPVGLGQAFGQGLQAMNQQYALAKKGQQEEELAQLHAALYKAQAGKLAAANDRQQQLASIMGDQPSTAPAGGPWSQQYQAQNAPVSPAEGFRVRGQKLLAAGFLKEGGDLIEAANKLDNNLEFKDGVWYDKRSGRAVAGGAGINQQGFGYQTQVGPGGQISIGTLPGASSVYGEQQNIGERARAAHDLVTVPPTAPNAPPTFNSRLNILQNGGAAGMSPAAAASQAADAAQQADVSRNFGKVYNDLQNAAMSNPAKMSKLKHIGSLLEGFEGGKLSGTGLEIASAANSLGVKIDSKLGNKQAAEALSNEISLDMRSTANGGGMPGAMSDADRNFLKNMSPSLAQSNDGRKKIIETKVKLIERENQIAGMARKYRQKYGRLDDSFFGQLQQWSNQNDMFK